MKWARTKVLRAFLLVLPLALTATVRAAGVEADAAAHTWQIETDLFQFTVDAARGGRISSLVYKPVGRETVLAGGGFCLDHFWEQAWPGEFLAAPYEVTAREEAGRVQVRASCVSTGKWGNTPPEPMSGLKLTRTMTVADGQPWITVEVEIANPTTATKMCGYWVQNCFYPDGKWQGTTYVRPSSVGINAVEEDEMARHTPGKPEISYVKAPVAGWTATLAPEAAAGFVFLMDYGEMDRLYNCVGSGTTEWMYARAVIPPGKRWSTRYTIRPFVGLDSVAHASQNAIVSVTPAETDDGVGLTFALLRSVAEVTAGTLTGEVVNLITEASVPIPAFGFGPLAESPVSHTFTRPGPLLQQILVRATLELTLADGTTARETFEYFYGGTLDFSGKNLRLDMSPIYVIPAPPRVRTYLKPDRIECIPHPGLNLVWGQGMLFDWYGMQAALHRIPDLTVIESVPYSGLLAEGLKDFPLSYDELLRQDVIVLTDVSAGALDDSTVERLTDFVHAGGGLLVFGGPWSLGRGGYATSRIGDLLPVDCLGPADFRFEPAPLRPTPQPAASPLSTVPWTLDMPRCYVIQEARPRAGAETWLRCGRHPAVVAWQCRRGRVMVSMMTPMGEPQPGETPWWTWSHWPEALAASLEWLAGQGVP